MGPFVGAVSLTIRAIRSAILALGPRHMWIIPPGNDRCSFIASTVSPSRHTENSSHCQNDGYGLQTVGRGGGDDALGSGLEGDTALAGRANDEGRLRPVATYAKSTDSDSADDGAHC